MFVEAQTLEVTWEWARMQGDLESSNSLGTWSAQWAGVWEPRREVCLYSLRGVLSRAERCWGGGGESVRSGEHWALLRLIGHSPCLSSYFPPWLWPRDLHFLPPLSILIFPSLLTPSFPNESELSWWWWWCWYRYCWCV